MAKNQFRWHSGCYIYRTFVNKRLLFNKRGFYVQKIYIHDRLKVVEYWPETDELKVFMWSKYGIKKDDEFRYVKSGPNLKKIAEERIKYKPRIGGLYE